ncbi:MAG: hypothetical protein ED556_01085 [Winogradskyella sp.]|uniref:hypothetical protein n=1 Tax=Winogradskyella sp. TaxID=1883156 RepID=UPI000F4190B4|nr:hypothetical protein [Winogradskyella sp.]RNC87812.1 MAG: hypothetical protein ED556_01085 [Winogradskyella sp.]
MKKFIYIVSFAFITGANCYAQKETQSKDELSYSCEGVVELDAQKQTITLTGNANLKTDVFEFQDADKILINKVSNEVIISGAYKVRFKGGTIERASELKSYHLRYKIGDKIAYLE